MRRLLAAGAASLLSALLVLAGPEPACACSCTEPNEEEAFDGAAAVFTGTLTDRDDGADGEATLEFTVHEVYKGEVAEEQGVSTPDSVTACGWSPPEGGTYLVYANLYDGGLSVTWCGASRELGDDPPRLGVDAYAPNAGEDGLSEPEPWPYAAGAALLVAATGTAWWLLRRRHLRRV